MVQLHKKFTDSQVRELINRYLRKEIKRKYIQEVLSIGKTRFFFLIKACRETPDEFSIKYTRNSKTSKIPEDIEDNIIKELQIEKDLIENKDVPLKRYNYSYIKDLLETKHRQRVSLPTIIDRAKKNDFHIKTHYCPVKDRINSIGY